QKKKGFLSRWLGTEAPAETPREDTAAPESEATKPAAETRPAADVAQSAADAAPERDTQPAPEPASTSWFGRLKAGLSKTSSRLTESITGLVTKKKLDHETLEDLEDLLIGADLGVDTSARITGALAKNRFDKTVSPEEIRQVMAD